MTKAALNTLVRVFWWTEHSVLLRKKMGVELLGSRRSRNEYIRASSRPGRQAI